MEDYQMQRTATTMIQKYGMDALPKAVEAARYYLEQGDEEAAKRWVAIGYKIKATTMKGKIDELEEA